MIKLCEFSESLHTSKYRGEGETFREAVNRWAGALSEGSEHFNALQEIFGSQRFLMGGRNQSAIGSPRRVTPYNCFVSRQIRDTLNGRGGITDSFAEALRTMQLGGGIGFDFSTLRPRGDLIKSLDSKASGPVSFMEIFNAGCTTIRSAGHRRGAMMAVLRIDHPDIMEFIRCKQNDTELRGFNISLGITDEFMEALEKDELYTLRFKHRVYNKIKARPLWEIVMQNAYDWSEPGVLFIDQINRMNNLHYCETIHTTNPCVTGDSEIQTTDGVFAIKDLVGKSVDVYCMDANEKLVIRRAGDIRQTSKSEDIINITTTKGSIRTTLNHKIYTENRGWVIADEIDTDDTIASLQRIQKSEKYLRVKLSTQKDYEPEHRFVLGHYVTVDGDDVHHIDGNTLNNTRSNLACIHHDDHSVLSNKGHVDWSIRCDVTGQFLKKRHKLTKSSIGYRSSLKGKAKVLKVERCGREAVYNMNVDDCHNFIANGLVVKNCGEQPLPPYGACLLGSFNLANYLEKTDDGSMMFQASLLKSDVTHIVRAMDNVVDIADYPLLEQEDEAKSKRRMGLGVTGVANCIETLGYPYGTPEFITTLQTVLTILRNACYQESVHLAKEKGAFPLYKKDQYLQSKFIQTLPTSLKESIAEHGIRNSHLLSIAPTGTISLCANNVSSGIEPVLYYHAERTIQTFDGSTAVSLDDFGVRYLGVKGKLAKECTLTDHLNVQATAQPLVDSAVSKTINFFPSKGSEDFYNHDFKPLYFKAWKGGLKGLTVHNEEGKRAGLFVEKKEEPEGQACGISPETGRFECS
jgi:ribonucleotide reductase alpha subunit